MHLSSKMMKTYTDINSLIYYYHIYLKLKKKKYIIYRLLKLKKIRPIIYSLCLPLSQKKQQNSTRHGLRSGNTKTS